MFRYPQNTVLYDACCIIIPLYIEWGVTYWFDL